MISNYFQKALFTIRRQVTTGAFSLLMILSCYVPCSAGTTEEIASLLYFVEQSECTFMRNGKQYNSLEARQHIEKKYSYYKEQIASTEDFILYSATKSSISGRHYRVICDGVGMDSSSWLNTELEKLRTK